MLISRLRVQSILGRIPRKIKMLKFCKPCFGTGISKPLTLMSLLFALSSGSAVAQSSADAEIATDTSRSATSDGADRILLAGQLRTFTQQVAAASCAVTSGVDVEEAHDVLEKAMADFDRYLSALRDGDEELHILGPEENPRIVADLAHVEEEWLTVHPSVEAVIADGSDVDASHFIDDHNLKLLELTTILSADIAGHYADPFEVSARDSLLIEIAGRQLMLTQKMAKDSCEIWSDYHSEEAKVDLAETMDVFENSLRALRFGLDAVGVVAAPNDVIREDLDILLARWEIVKVNQQTLLDGGELNLEQKTEIFHDLLLELEDLNHLVHDYKEYAERGE